MALTDTHLLNITFLENRLGDLGLKNWWVAESIGVDRKTLTRWLSGKVKTIKDENLKALSACLQCQPEDLILKDESSVVASKEEQSIAAELIVQENLLATLTPLGQWPLLESIVKATMQPNLSVPVMGKLYNLLSICSWRQGHIEKAQGFANKALQLGEKVGHRGVIAQARSNLAITYFYQGRLKDSIPLYELVINERQFIDEDRTVAAAMSNLAQDYHQYGDFDKSRRIQLQAIELYTKLALPLNLSIAYCGLGLLETEVGNYEQAKAALKKSLDLAAESNYVRGLSAHKIYLADCLARQGDLVQAKILLDEGFRGMELLKLFEAQNFEIRARLYRLRSKFTEAEADLKAALVYGKDYPLELAAVWVEFAELCKARGDRQAAEQNLERAQGIYSEAGAMGRMSKR